MEEKIRIYNRWAGNPEGVPEDTSKCIKTVWRDFEWGGGQCSRKRRYGYRKLYCKQHAKLNLKGDT